MILRHKTSGTYYTTDGIFNTLTQDWNHDGDRYTDTVMRIWEVKGNRYGDINKYGMEEYEFISTDEKKLQQFSANEREEISDIYHDDEWTIVMKGREVISEKHWDAARSRARKLIKNRRYIKGAIK